MPKKKQVTFQSHIPGKFIPREDSSAFRSGTRDHRFNSKMAELLADPQRESDSKPSAEGAVLSSSSPETSGTDSSRVQSKQLHRRIVTMLETLRRRGGNGAATTSPPPSPRLASAPGESKSQPITFGQLRTANDPRAEVNPRPAEQQSSVPRVEEPSLTVDEILATYYSKVQVPTAAQVQSSSNLGFYIHSPSTPPLVLNEQNRHRPPPPSYSSSVPRPALVVRPPPPRYESPSAVQIGFDREFSRLLYGREGGVKHRQKRKAFSDPVKKSVEEAGRAAEKSHRRLTTHLNRTETVREEEENGSDSTTESESNSFHRRGFPRSVRNAIVPANPVLKKAIPPFLRVYSQAASSNDILLHWHLFSDVELESFEAMMTKLYKDENYSRVQCYENYRAALVSLLSAKEEDTITTTAL